MTYTVVAEREAPRKRYGRAAAHSQLSSVLAAFAVRQGRDGATIGDLMDAMGNRSLGALLVCFAAPSVLPIPGISTVMAVPLIYVSLQLVCGRTTCRLPRSVVRRKLRWSFFDRLVPYVAKAERLLRPRLPALVSSVSERIIGLLAIGLAGILFLPIPLGNMAPALSIAILGMALVQKDGLAALVGIAAGLGSAVLALGVAAALAAGAWHVAVQLFGG